MFCILTVQFEWMNTVIDFLYVNLTLRGRHLSFEWDAVLFTLLC
jgi:hypothetical protein